MDVELLNIEGLQTIDPSSPVVMVNLMRFRKHSPDGGGSGWDAYRRYSALAVPMIKARGGSLFWAGEAGATAFGDAGRHRWDYVAMVRYPAVTAFTDMMTSDEYRTLCDPHRRNGCEEHLIICTRELYHKGNAAAAR